MTLYLQDIIDIYEYCKKLNKRGLDYSTDSLNSFWFQRLKDYVQDFPKINRDLTEEDHNDFPDQVINGYTFPLIGTFSYRDLRVPVYLDDPGQQVYIVYNDEVFGGGAYNFIPEYDFAAWLDDQID